MTYRTYSRVLLIALSLVVMVLAYFYTFFLRPPANTVEIQGNMRVLYSIYGYGTGKAEQLSKPSDTAVDGEGNIYVSDTGNSRVLVFAPGGSQLLRSIGYVGPYKGHMLAPVGIEVDSQGERIFVADRGRNMLLIFDKKGELVKEVAVEAPLIPVLARDKLFLTTFKSVLVMNLEGKILQRWGSRGREPGQFDFPNGIDVDDKGQVYISDLNNLRLQVLDKKGNVIHVRGDPAKDIMAEDREFGLPAGLALDGRNRIFLVDAFHNMIRVIDAEKGTDVGSFGDFGYDEGQFSYPTGITHLGGSRFAVADKYNDRIQVVSIRP